MPDIEIFCDVMRRQGITRRSFMKYCSLTASALGLGPAFVPQIAHATETKPQTPVARQSRAKSPTHPHLSTTSEPSFKSPETDK